mmetsp:Transcript_31350/g.94059  ORF Transcript_31350/g.94059 Transcript_31350/m.94059 type:complete len:910 (+) Transcript_31350:681-3410(+)
MQRALSLLGRRSFASPAFAPATISGLSPNKVAEATALGFHPADTAIIAFGAGAVNNTLLSLMSQVSEDLAIVSTHAEHIAAEGVSLQHRGDEYVVPPGVITIKEAACDKNPRIILNGRQVGGCYDEIFDAVGPGTEFIVTAQNGPSARMLADAARDYLARKPDRAAAFANVVGIDAAMFVKMSATDSRAATVLQPGARWVFGAYELGDGGASAGIAPGVEVSGGALAKAEKFTEWFRLLDATDAGTEDADVSLRPEAVSGKLAKTANNIGGNYGAAIVTKVVEALAAENGVALDGPLPYGVLHKTFDVAGELGPLVGAERLDVLKRQIEIARDMSLRAVGEYHDVHEELFEGLGMTKSDALEAAKLYWTEVDADGQRVPSKHPPTHALAVFERRPSEPLLDDIVDAVGDCQTVEMRTLLTAFRRAEESRLRGRVPTPLAHDFKWTDERGWLETPAVDAIKARLQAGYDPTELVKVQCHHFQKPMMPDIFVSGLRDMGEHAMSFQERLGEYKAFYEALPGAPPFYNLTIGGVYRDTPDRTEFSNVSRGYVTHATATDKAIVAEIFARLGVDVEPKKVGISPLRSKVFLQHLLSLFKPGKVVAHMPTYASTTDAGKNTSGHEIVAVPATEANRFAGLFKAAREASAAAKPDEPVVLLLLEPHNPTAIAMNADEVEEFHDVVRDCPNLSVIHDIAYQGYQPQQQDSGKRYRDDGMPHKDQIYVAVLSTSKSMYASGQPALYMADKNSLPFLVDHYQRVATGPTSVFVHDLPYYRDTLDDEYMPSVYEKLQKPMLKFIDERKAAWGCDYLARPDGPPFITLDVRDKLAALGLSNKGFRELSLRLGCPLLCDTGVLRIALTGFDKSKHDEVLPHILERLDMLMSLQADDELIVAFKQYNPYYRKDGKAAKTIMG